MSPSPNTDGWGGGWWERILFVGAFMPKRGLVMYDDTIAGWLSWLGHSLSGLAILGAIVGWFPPVAAFVALIWYLVQLYESKTVQGYLSRRRIRQIAKLTAQIKILETAESLRAHKTDK